MKISVIELGLIYGIKEEQRGRHSRGGRHDPDKPRCPIAPELMAAVHRATEQTEGVLSAHVNLTFTPLWDPRKHASEDALIDMGIF